MGDLAAREAQDACSGFDAWSIRAGQMLETRSADIGVAAGFMRRLDLTLRTPDALHTAIAQRVGARLATLDRRMAADAVKLGLPVS